jgi:hypothetical protein
VESLPAAATLFLCCHPERSGRPFPTLANASAGRVVEGSWLHSRCSSVMRPPPKPTACPPSSFSCHSEPARTGEKPAFARSLRPAWFGGASRRRGLCLAGESHRMSAQSGGTTSLFLCSSSPGAADLEVFARKRPSPQMRAVDRDNRTKYRRVQSRLESKLIY